MVLKINKITLVEGASELSRRDSDFADLIEEIGLPNLRSRKPGFDALIKIICGQQISTAAARAITRRLVSIENPITPATAIKLGPKILREVGLSSQKIEYVLGIAEAIKNDRLDLRKIARMKDEEAITELTKLKGIGRWSAEVYLLFALRRPDLWPADDLGIVKGLMQLKGLSSRPHRDGMMEMAEAWRPWRSVAARLLWHYINWIEHSN